MTILVTAFDPFGGESINPAALATATLAPEIAGARIIRAELPTEFKRSEVELCQLIDRYEPDAVMCVGQAGGRSAVTPERVAINVSDAPIADNAGRTPIDEPIAADGPAAYFSTLPVKAIVAAIRAEGLPSQLSNTAGTFVCNHAMYTALHHLATTGRSHVRAGFIHVPFLPQQVAERPGQPSMSREDITRALTAALRTVATTSEDTRVTEGTTH